VLAAGAPIYFLAHAAPPDLRRLSSVETADEAAAARLGAGKPLQILTTSLEGLKASSSGRLQLTFPGWRPAAPQPPARPRL
jgi:hypothetical protein